MTATRAADTALASAPARSSGLVGTGTLVRLALRRDRVMLPVWLAVQFLLAAGSAASVKDLYSTATSRAALAATAGDNPATIAMYGPPDDLGTLGGLATWKLGVYGAGLLALMSIFTLVRHTRGDEEPGRLELVCAGVVGRYSALTAGVVVALGANLVAVPVVGVGLASGGIPASEAFTFGFAIAAAGFVFTGVAAVTAQLTETSRAANGIAAATLAAAYLLRAVGDSTHQASFLSWISPLGWTLQVRAFAAQPHVWVFGLAALATAALLATGYVLAGHRDIGAGLLPPRLGPATGGRLLRSPFALAWRLQRGLLLGWAIGFAVLSGALGSVAAGVTDFANTKQIRDMLAKLGGEQNLVDSYLSFAMSAAGIVAAVYATQALLRLRAEETGLRAEPLLATRVGRLRWAASHLVLAVLGIVALLTLSGLVAGLAHGLRTGDVGGQVPRLLAAGLVQVPAALVVAGIAVFLFGLLPRLTVAAWAVLGAFLLIGEFGGLFKLNHWVLDVSPFTHLPKLPGGDVAATPIVVLLAVAAGFTAVGLAAFRRRDIG